MTVVFSGITGLSILQIEDELVYVDNQLKVYDRLSIDDPFIAPKEVLQRFIKATKKYYEGWKYKQYEALAYKEFANSDFVKQAIEEETKNA